MALPSIFFLQVLELWPGCLQFPQMCCFLAGGGGGLRGVRSVNGVVVEVGMIDAVLGW